MKARKESVKTLAKVGEDIKEIDSDTKKAKMVSGSISVIGEYFDARSGSST